MIPQRTRPDDRNPLAAVGPGAALVSQAAADGGPADRRRPRRWRADGGEGAGQEGGAGGRRKEGREEGEERERREEGSKRRRPST